LDTDNIVLARALDRRSIRSASSSFGSPLRAGHGKESDVQILLSLQLEVERNVIRVDRAMIRGLGDCESELERVRVEAGGESVPLSLEGPAPAAPATLPASTPAGTMFGPPPAKAADNGRSGRLAADLLALGMDGDAVANCLQNHSLDRLIKLLAWVRGVQAREGCTNPAAMYLRCLAKGVQ
jgi:hypothetical protein